MEYKTSYPRPRFLTKFLPTHPSIRSRRTANVLKGGWDAALYDMSVREQQGSLSLA